MHATTNLIESMSHEPLFDEFRRSFTALTGMPLALRSVDSGQLPHRGNCGENGFCALVAGSETLCADCLRTQQRLVDQAVTGTTVVTCQFGLREAAVPVRVGHDTIGILQTGQAMALAPTKRRFRQVVARADQSGAALDHGQLERAYYGTPVVSDEKMNSAAGLLAVFAEHLSLQGNQIALRASNLEPDVVRRGKQFIREHLHEPLPLARVAAAVHVSPFYFCKLFSKGGGVSFKEYVSRARVEEAKSLLLNPNKRISEVCFEVGFNSLTSFNRVFHQVTGMTPSEYRDQLPGPPTAG